jgi:glycosyltransferase involved in cell wall biosynthesis
MNILILNWRDPKNPFAGGAEKLNMEILKPFIERGNRVVWYAQSVKGLPSGETYKDIKIIRFGSMFTHFLFWPFFYWTNKFGKVDLIIDSIHGTGYLSPIFASKVRKIILVCEVAQNIWDEMFAFPINKIGKIWEKIMLWFYKNNKFWTISKSTKDDLVNFGIPFENIQILPMGFDAIKLSSIPGKYNRPTALFVGRLAEMKGIKDAIRAIFEINKNLSKKWSLNIIGKGEKKYEGELKTLVSELGSNKYANFLGHVDEKKKFEEMAKAWALLVPSSREGWGMVVPEANHVGTLVIGYNSPGLSESLIKYSKSNVIIDGKVSEIVKELKKIDNPLRLEEKIIPGWGDLHEFVLSKFLPGSSPKS